MNRQWVPAAAFAALLLHFGAALAGDPVDRQAAIHFTLSDTANDESVFRIHDEPPATPHEHYPNCVSHAPGRPGKPIIERPGDINNKECPADRYCMDDHERAGNPHQVAWWAKCAINKNYSAWFVGGGTPWIFPRKTRARTEEEGTWGMDYDGLFRPRRVWMNWSCGREQGGLGAYETDGAPAIVERFKLH